MHGSSIRTVSLAFIIDAGVPLKTYESAGIGDDYFVLDYRCKRRYKRKLRRQRRRYRWTQEQLQYAGRAAITYFLANAPCDLIHGTPMLDAINANHGRTTP